MERLALPKRHVLAVLWLGLLLVGCLAQVGIIQPAADKTGKAPEDFTLVKANPQGLGSWQARPDGKTDLTVRIGTTNPPPLGSFSTKKVDLTAIAKVTAVLTLTDTSTTASPTTVTPINEVGGYVSAPGGSFSLTFPPIAKGTKRVLVITGYTAANAPVPGAVIKTLFDNTADTGSFEISYRTTPAAAVFEDLGATAAATVTTSALNAALDAVTGYAGTPGVYPQCHPARVDIAALLTLLNSNGGDLSPVIAAPATYRLPGTEVSHQFALPPNPVAADMPKLYCSDPATEVMDLGVLAPSGSPGTYNTTNGSVTATISAAGVVDVTFHKVPAGTWDIGAKLAGDGTAPNAKYFQVLASTCGYAESITVTGATQTAFAAGPYHAVEPKSAIGQIRWHKTNATGFKVQDLASNLPSVLSAAVPADSIDFNVYVGPKVAGYSFTGNLIPSGAINNMQILGPPNVSEADRPKLAFGLNDTFQLSSSATIVRDVAIIGASVNLPNGGTLQRVTVEGQRIATGQGSAIGVPSGTFLLDGVRVYNVRHTSLSPIQGVDALAGIMVGGSATGTIQNCLVDDKGLGGNSSIRFDVNGSQGSLAGIGVQSTLGVTIANTNVVAIGRIAGSGLTAATMSVAGIHAGGGGPIMITGCTVSNIEAQRETLGISLSSGTVANCTIENLPTPPGVSPKVRGLRIGGGSANVDAHQNTLRNLGEAAPTTPTLAVDAIIAEGAGASPTLRVHQNQITNCGGEKFAGITVIPAGTFTTWQISDNSITNCAVLDSATSGFHGIDTLGANLNLPDLRIFHNNIQNNLMFGQGFGIRVDAASGTVLVDRNRIDGNTCNSTSSTTATQYWQMIFANLSGTVTTTVKDNVITGNQLRDSATNQSITFRGIWANNASSNNVTVRNNQISGNGIGASGTDNGSINLIDAAGPAIVHSNRIFNQAVAGTFPSTLFYRAIKGNVTPGQSVTIDRNIIADLALGDGSATRRPAIDVNCPSAATAVIRHNSIKMGKYQSAAIYIMGNGTATIVNNAMLAATSGTGASAVDRSTSGPATVDYNWIFGWSSPYGAFISGAATNTQSAVPPFGNSDSAVDVGGHAMGTSGLVGNSAAVIGAQGSFTGVAALDAAPAY